MNIENRALRIELSLLISTDHFKRRTPKENISCNIIAAYYHDHIFVAKKDAARAMSCLKQLTAQ